MDKQAVDSAVAALASSHRGGAPLPALPEASRPETIAEGHAIQDALIAELGEPVAGYKVAGLKPGEVMRGAVLKSRFLSDGGRISAARVPLLGVESEIAFRLDKDFPAREQAYGDEEVRAAVTAVPAIELVATRFADYKGTPVLHRLGDFMSNGALICGAARTDWRSFEFATIGVTLRSGETILAQSRGGHSTIDPFLPVLALVNELRSGPGVKAGQVVTTGTFTGLQFATAPTTLTATFDGFGSVTVHIDG